LIEKEKIRNVKKLVDPLEGNGIIKKGLMTIKGILTGKPVRKTWQDECIKEKVAHLDKDKLRQDCKKLF
jgi:hypothetical protein